MELEFYQPTAINALVEFEDSMSADLLADDASLGKTVEVICVLLRRSNSSRPAKPTLVLSRFRGCDASRNNRNRSEAHTLVARARPSPVYLPDRTSYKLSTAITLYFKNFGFTDRLRIVMYYGDLKQTKEQRVVHQKGVFDKQTEYFQTHNKMNFDTTVLSTYTTWSFKHGSRE
jgi:hypothetical protein